MPGTSAWCALNLPSKRLRFMPWAIVMVLIGGSCAFWNMPAAAQSTVKPGAKATCASCHAGVVSAFAHAPMAHAMETVGSNPTLETHPKLNFQLGAYLYSVETRDGKSTYTVTDGTETMTLPIRWIFGQNSQTWVFEMDGRFYESLVSYYPRGESLGITPGDERLTPHTLKEAMGRELAMWETRQCFNCHATGAVIDDKLALESLHAGLTCERCHEGAQKHMADAKYDDFSSLPKSLGHLSSGDVANFCGQCHRTWETVVRNHWHGLPFVRFQPYRLANSKCFDANDPRISCLACHDPHQTLNRNDASYDAKCLACHGQQKSVSISAGPKACPVAKTNCVSCHMPKVDLPGTRLRFTDHEIRIVRAGDSYPN